ELRADLVLEGTIHVHADRLRVSAHLVDAKRDENIWVETYELPVTDVFAAQSDVAIRVARALEVQLSPREHRLLRAAPTRSAEAYHLYLRGRDAWSRRRPSDASRAAAFFEEALALDPEFAAAWSGLADAHLVHAQTGVVPLAAAVSETRAAVGRALALDPSSGEARATLGLILVFIDCDHAGGGRELRRAVELSPSHATARQWYGQWLASDGRHDEARAQLEEARALDRMSPAVREGMGLALYFAGRTREAEEQFRDTLASDPDFARAHLDLAVCRGTAGDAEGFLGHFLEAWSAGIYGGAAAEAEAAASLPAGDPADALEFLVDRARARVKSLPMARMAEILLLVQMDRRDEAVQALEAARRSSHLGFILQFAPALDPLAGDAAFQQLMRDAGLLLPRWRR
ncbi:MAG: tetratricopeptide repeat protein, partial [Gemmatimonadota bacterium]